MRMEIERATIECVKTVDPELAAALAYEAFDTNAMAYADQIGLPDLTTLDLF